jgi:hypothetical protein
MRNTKQTRLATEQQAPVLACNFTRSRLAQNRRMSIHATLSCQGSGVYSVVLIIMATALALAGHEWCACSQTIAMASLITLERKSRKFVNFLDRFNLLPQQRAARHHTRPAPVLPNGLPGFIVISHPVAPMPQSRPTHQHIARSGR